MTRADFVPIVTYLSAGAGKPMERDQIEVYYDLLSDLPLDVLKAAVKRALCESRFPTVPPVGTIRALAAELSAPARALLWPEAWELARAAVRRFGAARPTRPHAEREALASLPPAVAHAARAVGWLALCDAAEGDLDTLRAQFRDAYGTLRGRDEREGLLPPALRQGALQRLTEGIGEEPKALPHRDEHFDDLPF